jgi:hypothetical protein
MTEDIAFGCFLVVTGQAFGKPNAAAAIVGDVDALTA